MPEDVFTDEDFDEEGLCKDPHCRHGLIMHERHTDFCRTCELYCYRPLSSPYLYEHFPRIYRWWLEIKK